MIYLVLCLSLFQSIQDNYYSKNSYQVTQIQVDTLSFEGDSLYWAKNWIARANYKHENFDKAQRIADSIPVDSVEAINLYYSILSLQALTNKTVGQISVADSLYRKAMNVPDSLSGVKYRVHLNYAELMRVQMRYDKRETHLLKAMSYAEGEERNKTVRVLARHYFNILLDFDSAEQILESHDEFEYLDAESKAGYRLVQAELAEAKESYDKAKEYYQKANRIARQAGFITFQYDAVDGAMRSTHLKQKKTSERLQWYLFNGLFIALILIIGGWNWYLKRRNGLRTA